jgi:hypothetical protein
MLAKSAGDRPQTMADVAGALRDCARALGTDVDAPLRPRIPVERPASALETAATQPPPAGPSGVDTARLRPPSRPVPVPDAIPQAVPPGSSRSNRVSGRGGDRASLSRPTTNDLAAQRTTTTLSSTAAEAVAARAGAPSRAARWVAAAAGVILLLGGAAFVLLRPRPAAAPVTSSPAASPPPALPLPAPAPEAPPQGAPKAAAPAEDAPSAVAKVADVGESVRIDFAGLPPGTTAQLDGVRVQLPIDLARGPGLHRIVLRPPGESSRAIELDGMRDRIVDFAAMPRVASATRERSPEREGTPPRSGLGSSHPAKNQATNPPKKAASGSSSDREAIIDL